MLASRTSRLKGRVGSILMVVAVAIGTVAFSTQFATAGMASDDGRTRAIEESPGRYSDPTPEPQPNPEPEPQPEPEAWESIPEPIQDSLNVAVGALGTALVAGFGCGIAPMTCPAVPYLIAAGGTASGLSGVGETVNSNVVNTVGDVIEEVGEVIEETTETVQESCDTVSYFTGVHKPCGH